MLLFINAINIGHRQMKRYEGTCEYCGCEYTTEYKNGKGYSYSVETRFCSKHCAGKHQAKKLVGGIQVDRGKELLITQACDFIQSKGSYCTLSELLQGIKVSGKTLVKHGIKASELNKSLGFVRTGSIFQKHIGQQLTLMFSDVECESCFEGLVGNTGYPLRVDFYIPSENLVVEADGAQHSNPEHPWAKWNNGTVKEYDEKKNAYFKKHGITLVRIPYTRKVTLDFVKSFINI